MQTKTVDIRKQLKKEEGFTLVEVIAVLVILGILAAVAIPKFFDMQNTAREKAIGGAIGELNGQVALAFAQNALDGGPAGGYDTAYDGDIGPEFNVIGQGDGVPGTGTIGFANPAGHVWTLTWNGPPVGNTDSPGYFSIGAKLP